MKLHDLINTTALSARLKIYVAANKEIVLLVDCFASEARKELTASTCEREIAFMSIMKDEKGVALNVLLAC